MLSAALALAALIAPARAEWAPANPAIDAYNDGVDALNAGDLDRAEAGFGKALKKDPACGLCATMQAQIAVRRNDPTAALSALRTLRHTYPDQPMLPVIEANAAFLAEQFNRSREAAAAAVALDPKATEAWHWSFRANMRLGDDRGTQVALGHLRGLMEPDQVACFEAELVLERGQHDAAPARIEACARAEPEAAATMQAMLDARTGRSDDLADQLDAAGGAGAATRVAQMRQDGETQAAAALALAALDARPRDAALRVQAALALVELGDRDQAIGLLEPVFGATLEVDGNEDGALMGVLTKSNARATQQNLSEGLMVYIEQQMAAGEVNAIEGAFDRLRRAHGDSGLVEGGAVVLDALNRGPRAAWSRLDTALNERPETPGVYAAALWMVRRDPTGATPSALAALRGPHTAFVAYRAAGAMADAGRPEACLALLRDRTVSPRALDLWSSLMVRCGEAAGDADAVAAANAQVQAAGGDAGALALQLASTRYRDQAWAGVVEALEGSSWADPEAASQARRLRVAALTQLGRLDAAQAAADGPLPSATRYNLANGLAQAERWDEALALLDGLTDPDPELDGMIASLLVDVRARSGDLDGARALLAGREVHPISRLNLAVSLYNAQRFDDAQAAIGGACVALEGPPRQSCDDLEAAIGQALE